MGIGTSEPILRVRTTQAKASLSSVATEVAGGLHSSAPAFLNQLLLVGYVALPRGQLCGYLYPRDTDL